MCKVYHKVRFENYVIISGIVEVNLYKNKEICYFKLYNSLGNTFLRCFDYSIHVPFSNN